MGNEDFEDQDETKTKRLSNRAKGDKKDKKGQKKVLTSSESEPEGDENVDETNSENTTAKKKRLSARNGRKSQNGKNSQNGKKVPLLTKVRPLFSHLNRQQGLAELGE